MGDKWINDEETGLGLKHLGAQVLKMVWQDHAAKFTASPEPGSAASVREEQ
jgi:hypothetical protein